MQDTSRFAPYRLDQIISPFFKIRLDIRPHKISANAQPFRVSIWKFRSQSVNLIIPSLINKQRITVRQFGTLKVVHC